MFLRDPLGHRPRQARLGIEALEDRMVLSSSPALVDLRGLTLDPRRYETDHILVQFQGAPRALAGTTIGQAIDSTSGLYEVRLDGATTPELALANYRQAAGVLQADFDYYLTSAATPNDPRFSGQWALRNTGQDGGKPGADIRATQAWDVTTGSTGTIIAINDTGVDYTHPDLYLNIWLNQGEIPASRRANLADLDGDGRITFRDLNNTRNQGAGKITDLNGNGRIDAGDVLRPMVKDSLGRDTGRGGWDNNVSDDRDGWVDDLIGWSASDGTNNPMDQMGHGTHVAGIIGAAGGNAAGVAGLNWKAQLMPIKFLDGSGNGTVSKFIAGLNYAVAHGARVSNNSWTGAGFSQMLLDAVSAARARGHVFVAAAGNAGLSNDTYPDYPGNLDLDNVVTVAATDRRDQLASFSNFGGSVDLAAPGVDIVSTTRNGGYGASSGTSMATPHVTGAVALVWAQQPEWSYRQVINQVLGTVDRLSSLSGKVKTGGRLNVAAAVGAAQVSAVAPRIVKAVPQGASASVVSSVRVTFDRVMNRASFTVADVSLVGPGGRIIAATNIKLVDGTGGRSFDVVFGAQTVVGTYTLKIGPNVTDLSGNRMALYQTTFTIPVPTVSAPRIVSAVPQGTVGSATAVRVTFDRAIALSSFTAGDVSLVGPGGRVVSITGVRVVSGTGDRTFDILFARQTILGTYTLKVGPVITDVRGVRMASVYQTTFVLKAPVSTVTTTRSYASSLAVNVPKGGRGVSLLTVGDSFTLADVNVKVNLTHPYVSDLYIHLQAPDGTVIVLFNRMGVGSANLTNTVFDDQASTIIGLGYGPFTGSYQPIVPLAHLNGKNARGTWKLWIEDRGAHAQGTLLNWSLTMRPKV